jgi:hypothetical protein
MVVGGPYGGVIGLAGRADHLVDVGVADDVLSAACSFFACCSGVAECPMKLRRWGRVGNPHCPESNIELRGLDVERVGIGLVAYCCKLLASPLQLAQRVLVLYLGVGPLIDDVVDGQ